MGRTYHFFVVFVESDSDGQREQGVAMRACPLGDVLGCNEGGCVGDNVIEWWCGVEGCASGCSDLRKIFNLPD